MISRLCPISFSFYKTGVFTLTNKFIPDSPIRGVLCKTQAFKKFIGKRIAFFNETVHRIALRMEPLCHCGYQGFGIALPPMLWLSVQHPHGAVIIQQHPGHRLIVLICNAACGEISNEIQDVPVTFVIPTKFPSLINYIGMWFVEDRQSGLKVTEEGSKDIRESLSMFKLLFKCIILYKHKLIFFITYSKSLPSYLVISSGKWLGSVNVIRCTKDNPLTLTPREAAVSFSIGEWRKSHPRNEK